MNNQNYYGNNSYPQPMYSQPFTNQSITYRNARPNQPITNMVFVVSLDEALVKATDRDSDVVFFDQNKPVFYRIKVDYNGIKSWQEFPYQVPNQAQNTPASQADVIALRERMEQLETEVKKYAQSNGRSTDETNATEQSK